MQQDELAFTSFETRTLVFGTLLQREERIQRRLVEGEAHRCFSSIRCRAAGEFAATSPSPTFSPEAQAVRFDFALQQSAFRRISLEDETIVAGRDFGKQATSNNAYTQTTHSFESALWLPQAVFEKRILRIRETERQFRQYIVDDEDDELQVRIEEALEKLHVERIPLVAPPAATAPMLSPPVIFSPNTSICRPISSLSVSMDDSALEARVEMLSCFVLRDMRLMPFFGGSLNGTIRRGDVLAAINGQRVHTIHQVADWEARASTLNEENYFTILRDGRKLVVKTT